MSDNRAKIDFEARAVLRKLPSIGSKPAQHLNWSAPYLIYDGKLGECIDQFMAKPASQKHLYEIHTASQADIAGGVMTSDRICALAGWRDILL